MEIVMGTVINLVRKTVNPYSAAATAVTVAAIVINPLSKRLSQDSLF